ncbi:hypothetical protein ACNOYE_19280 [Nannocystaceae bacterium ST9]
MPSEVAVTLICAAEQEAALTGLIQRIELAGLPLRVLFDAQREPERVVEVIEAIGERGLFVICESEPIDELGFRRVEGAIARHGTPLHRLIRLDVFGRSPRVLVTRIVRECEELAKLESPQRGKPPPAELAPVDEQAGISLPAIRLEPGEQLDGDTLRIDLPDSPKLAELARRRKALRERGQGPARLPAHDVGSTAAGKLLEREREFEFDRKTLLMLIGAALLAVLVALVVSGGFG